jgi:hypothetical protein
MLLCGFAIYNKLAPIFMLIMTLRTIFLGLVFACFSQPLLASDSLCHRGETTYFSCAVKSGKLVSLCGNAYVKEESGNWIEPDKPWLQYRFGLPDKIDLMYPPIRKGSVEKFQGDYGTALQGAVIWKSVSFVSAGIGYKMEYLVPEGREPFEGVRIGDPKKMDIQIPASRKSHYPKADIPCVGKSSHDHFKFDELTRFLTFGRYQ